MDVMGLKLRLEHIILKLIIINHACFFLIGMGYGIGVYGKILDFTM